MTTRWNAANNVSLALRFSENLFTHAPWQDTTIVINLDTLEEYDVLPVVPELGANTASTAISKGCVIQDFEIVSGVNRRAYVCETCLYREAHRGLWARSGPADEDVSSAVAQANDALVVMGGGTHPDNPTKGLGIWALDLMNGGFRTFAPSFYLVNNVSLVDPYIVLSHGDGEVHLIDTRDWSDTNVTNDPSLQWRAASDGKTIVWIDQRFHPGGDLETPANQEVVAYDIATKTMKRLTYTDPQVKPSAKWDPAVEGDWVVWQDDRDSDNPNSTTDAPKNRVDIYGYNLRTNQEYHILGNQAGTLPESAHSPGGLLPSVPRLHRGKLYVLGLYMVQGNAEIQVWEFALPQR